MAKDIVRAVLTAVVIAVTPEAITRFLGEDFIFHTNRSDDGDSDSVSEDEEEDDTSDSDLADLELEDVEESLSKDIKYTEEDMGQVLGDYHCPWCLDILTRRKV